MTISVFPFMLQKEDQVLPRTGPKLFTQSCKVNKCVQSLETLMCLARGDHAKNLKNMLIGPTHPWMATKDLKTSRQLSRRSSLIQALPSYSSLMMWYVRYTQFLTFQHQLFSMFGMQLMTPGRPP